MQATEGTVTDVTIVRQVSDGPHFHSDLGRRIVEGTERGSMTKKRELSCAGNEEKEMSENRKVVIHDLTREEWEGFVDVPEDVKVIADDGSIKKCIGCFGCWVKTPGQCVIADDYQKMGAVFGGAEELVIISRCSFGSYSPFVKNVLDRSISYMLPYFENRNHEMHHRARYGNHIRMRVYFYGEDITAEEKHTAEQLVEANAVNFQGIVEQILFVNEKAGLKEVVAW